jgi:hypothetical protein
MSADAASTIAGIPAGIVVTAVTTLVSGALAAFLTSLLTARRSNDEKIWEMRRIAYGIILAELLAVERVLDDAAEYIEEDKSRYFHGKEAESHNTIINRHMLAIRKSYTENYLVLSDPFIAIFEAFTHQLRASSTNQNLMPFEYLSDFEKAVRLARPKLLTQARSEMPLRRTLRDRLSFQRVARWLLRFFRT